jgi:hypothetical protein
MTITIDGGITFTGGLTFVAGIFYLRKAIFIFGNNSGTECKITNLVSDTGVVAADITYTSSTARGYLAAAGYGFDKAISGFGSTVASGYTAITNLVSNTGVVSSDQAAVTGTVRSYLAAATYGQDKAIFGYGLNTPGASVSMTNLVSNTGVVATDTTGVGTVRYALAAAGYGSSGQAIFGFGYSAATYYSLTNLVSNTGVVATDTAGVGTARFGPAAAGYGGDKAIFGFGLTTGGASAVTSTTNLVSNTGVVASDQTALTGTARTRLGAATYGSDKVIFGFGDINNGSQGTIGRAMTNLVSNTGVVAADQSAITGTARFALGAASYSSA